MKELQSLPLSRKIQITQARIIEWYSHYNGNVCVSFSGGKDSTVLLHIARQLYPDIPAVFSNTGLEYAAIQKFVRSFDLVDIIAPEMRFDQVIMRYGYPLIGKEVAEAIYYARRIRPTERERETDGHPQTDGTARSSDNLIQTSAARNRRTILQGKWGAKLPGKDWNSGGQTKTPQPIRKRKELLGHRAGVALTGQTGEGGVFSNPADQFGEKSQFNKEKWLPLARDVPLLISHYCCQKMKKQPIKHYQKNLGYKPILATLAEESRIRKQAWIRHGCNAFESANPMSQPMSFWTEQDVLAYIVRYNLPIASVYGEIVSVGSDGNEYPPVDVMGIPQCNLKCTGCQRTGCVYCLFGAHLEKPGQERLLQLAKIEPRKYEYAIGGGNGLTIRTTTLPLPKWMESGRTGTRRKSGLHRRKGLVLEKQLIL